MKPEIIQNTYHVYRNERGAQMGIHTNIKTISELVISTIADLRFYATK